jgi:hypothetical protein
MITALNMTVPLKQDPESLEKLQQLKAAFADVIQPAIDAALRKSKIVHFARVLVIHDKYMQVITEFDGDPMAYTEFFRLELPAVFKPIFELAEGVPPWDEINNQDSFFEASKGFQVRALGRSTDGRPEQGWLFSYFDKSVREIEEALSGGDSGGLITGDSTGTSGSADADAPAAQASPQPADG